MIDEVILSMHKIANAAEAMIPFADIVGLDKIGNIVQNALDIVDNVSERISEAKTVSDSKDEEEIAGITNKLRAINDALDREIDNT